MVFKMIYDSNLKMILFCTLIFLKFFLRETRYSISIYNVTRFLVKLVINF